jgi:hypothetical protein
MTSAGRTVLYAVYVSGIAALAVLGGVRQSAPYYLAAVALTLPLGALALALIYLCYPLLVAVGGLFADARLPDGTDAAWLTIGRGVVNAALLVAAALLNSVLLERWRRRRHGTPQQPIRRR